MVQDPRKCLRHAVLVFSPGILFLWMFYTFEATEQKKNKRTYCLWIWGHLHMFKLKISCIVHLLMLCIHLSRMETCDSSDAVHNEQISETWCRSNKALIYDSYLIFHPPGRAVRLQENIYRFSQEAQCAKLSTGLLHWESQTLLWGTEIS